MQVLFNFIKFGLTKIKSMDVKIKLPVICPSCTTALQVAELSCSNCHTKVSGKFNLPVLTQLSQEDQEFILQFFLHSGSLKQMALQMNISYPTLRNKLDDMIEAVQTRIKK